MHGNHTTRLPASRTAAVLLALGLALLSGCVSASETPVDHPLEELTGALREVAAAPANLEFPLALGNTWVYTGVAESPPLAATYVVTETVADILRSAERPYTIIQIERQSELTSCPEERVWCEQVAPLEPVSYWYAIDGSTFYRQESLAAHRLLERSTVELVFPLTVEAKWYITPAMQAAHPSYDLDSMLRRVEQRSTLEVPAGELPDCYLLTDVVGGTETSSWFCPGIGFAVRQMEHHGTPWRSGEWLVSYSID